jgi:hypothetical protein
MLWQDMFVESLRFQAKGDLYTAIEYLNRILLAKPDFTPAWNNRASMIAQLGQPFDAIVNYDRAIAVDPEAFEFYNNRGAAYMDLDMFERALEDFDVAIMKGGRIPEIYNNKGACYRRLGRIEESLDEYKIATEVGPDYVDGHLGYSFCLLQLGQFEEGWKEYEWRWKSSQSPARNLPYPEWQGKDAESKDDILLLYGEQGMGDILQFMRYVAVVRKFWHGQLFLEVRHPVVRLAETMGNVDRIVSFGEMLPDGIVACAPLMSLPRILWPVYNEIPSKCPYIHADKHRVGIFREQLKAMPPGMLVGVCWAGMNRDTNPLASSIDRRRSLTLNSFAPIAESVPDLAWISLQMGPPAPQCRKPPRGMAIGDFTADFYDFYDTAAMIENLDLVITVDTSVAHLAGALGKPVWMLSRFDNCWRWLDNREDTAWYPSMRIFGQKKMGDWDEVIERVARELQFLAKDWKQKAAA